MGNVCAMVMFLLMYMIGFFINSDDMPTSTRTAASLSSHTGFSFALNLFLLVESESVGITNKTVGMIVEKYSISIYIGMAIVNILFFLIFGLYLDQVFPNEFGKKKHPLFFIKCFFASKPQHNSIVYETN